VAIRLTKASSQYVRRTGTVVDYNQPYSLLASILVVADYNDYSNIFCIGDAGTGYFDFLEIYSDGVTPRIGRVANWSASTVLGDALTPGAWYDIALVRASSTDLRMFLNGAQTGGVDTNTTQGRVASNYIDIGLFGKAYDYAGIRVANVQFFQRALTPIELSAQHRRLRPVSRDALWAWYPMVHGTLAGSLLDHSGNGRHLTAGGTPTIEDGPPVCWGVSAGILVPVHAAGEPVEIECATGAAVGAGVTASVSSPITIACNVGHSIAAGLAAAITQPTTIACGAGQAVAAGLTASVSNATTIQAGIGAAVASGLTAGIASPVTIACAVGQAEASGLQASISAGVVIDCATGAATAAGLQAGVSSPVTIACETGAAAAAGLQAAVSSDAAILAQAGRAVAAGLPATVSSPVTIAAGVGHAEAAGLPASVTSGAIVLADVGRAVAAGLPATIETVVSLSGWQKPAGKARKYRRVILGDRLYEVLERDIPALLEAELLDRAPPTTAEVIEGPKPRRKRARKAPQPVKTVAEVREAVQQIKARIEPDNAWLAQALETVAFRVLERLQDEEDSLMLLLAA